jgi:hypothetical protein
LSWILRQFKEENASRVPRARTDKFSDLEMPQRQCLKTQARTGIRVFRDTHTTIEFISLKLRSLHRRHLKSLKGHTMPFEAFFAVFVLTSVF